MTKFKQSLDVFGLNYEIMQLSEGRESDAHFLSVCSTNEALMAHVELMPWFDGEPINDLPSSVLNVEGGIPALKFQPGMN